MRILVSRLHELIMYDFALCMLMKIFQNISCEGCSCFSLDAIPCVLKVKIWGESAELNYDTSD